MTFPSPRDRIGRQRDGLDDLSKEAETAIINNSIKRLHHFLPLGKGSNAAMARSQAAVAAVVGMCD